MSGRGPATAKRLQTRASLSDAAERTATATELRRRYENGSSLRRLARDTGYAYGTVRTLLIEVGTTLRRAGAPTSTPGGETP